MRKMTEANANANSGKFTNEVDAQAIKTPASGPTVKAARPQVMNRSKGNPPAAVCNVQLRKTTNNVPAKSRSVVAKRNPSNGAPDDKSSKVPNAKLLATTVL
jgi:hypothetical protein